MRRFYGPTLKRAQISKTVRLLSGTSSENGVTITNAPASDSSAIVAAWLAKIVHTANNVTGSGHPVGSIGYGVLDAATKTAGLIIGAEGKISILNGRATIAVPGEFQIADNADTIDTGILADCQLVSNGGTVTLLAGLRVAFNNSATLGTVYGTYLQTGTGTAPTTFIGHLIADQAGTTVRGIESQITSGSGKHALYLSGSAPSYLAALVKIGATGDTGSGALLQVTGGVEIYADNGLFFTNTSNGAGASVGTLTNAPAAGNPAWWVKIKVGTTPVAFPVWVLP